MKVRDYTSSKHISHPIPFVQAICANEKYKELKWIAGFFYWVDQVQPYDSEGWVYLDELHKFVDNGMEGDAFINAVSGIVNRVSHSLVPYGSYLLLLLALEC